MSTSIRQRASQSVTPAPIPRGPDGRAIRLSSIKEHRQSTPFRLETSITPRFLDERPKPQCRNKECPQSKVEEMEGKSVCLNCGFVLQESQITQELTFGETSNGAAIVQGAYVGQDEEVARNPQMAGNRMGGGMSSREQTERNGSHFMNSLVQALRLQQIDKERGMKYFKLAAGNNFIQGRISRHVAAVCLYLACRGEQTCKVMLIDFADILTVNVFKLGQIYNALVETLHLAGQGIRGNLYECNPENLIQRFAQDLEFGADEHKIANEAVGILQRMRRDWIYTGRRPAGVCGAALILAARMNNYRRTVREVVYTAKVADVTINKRLDEFKFTDSSKLTVKEFRDFAHNLEKAHDPPSYYRQFEKKKSRKSTKRKRDETTDQEHEEDGGTLAAVSRRSSVESEEEALTREERDQRAMPPPAIPIDPQLQDLLVAQRATVSNATPEIEDQNEDVDDDDAELSETSVVKRSRGRPKGSKNTPLPVKTAVAIADEEQTEIEMLEALADPENIAQAELYHHQILPTPPPTQEAVITTIDPPTSIDLDSIVIGDHEFDDDPEVRDCLLPPEDVAIKEAVWVTNNGKWLKDQQARKIKQELAEKSGTVKVTKKRRRHRKRLGDMTAYDIHQEDGTITRPETAAEATRMMLEMRGYSKKINYDAIVGRVYNRSPSEESGSTTGEYRSFLRSGTPNHKNSTSKDAAKRRKSAAEETSTQRPTITSKFIKAPSRMKRNPIAPRRRGISQQEDVYASERSDLVNVLNEAIPAQEDGDGDEDDEEEVEQEVEQDEGREGGEDDDHFTDHGEEYE